jgi:hypothetical protein
MPHNGHRAQCNPWFLNFGNEFAFINHIKNMAELAYQSGGARVDPSTLNDFGLPTSGDGVFGVFWIPSQTDRPGNWVVKWTGTLDVNRRSFTHTVVSGSTSGSNGRFVLTPTGNPDSSGGLRIDLGCQGFDDEDPCTDWAFVHEDDEEAFDNGEIYTEKFKEIAGKFGVIRFLDWMPAGGLSLPLWSQRKPLNYVSYAANYAPAAFYRGATTNVGDDYTIDLGDGGTPADKDCHLIFFNASASTSTVTINGIGVGSNSGDGFATTERPLANRYAFIFYDADLGIWLKRGGDTALGNRFFPQRVPMEAILRLCKDVGAHPWLHIPFTALDPMTDMTTQMASFVKAYTESEASWMIPRFEPCNEVWNSAGGFDATRYAWNKAQVRAGWGGGDFQHSDWYGRALSWMGEAIHGVYNPTGAKSSWPYQVICAVQTNSGAPSGSDARLGGKHVSVDGGDPASDWATHVAVANYFNAGMVGSTTALRTTPELQMAYDYSIGDAEEQAAIADEYAAATLIASDTTSIPTVLDRLDDWKDWADGFGLGLCFYEGGFSPDDPTANTTATITGITNADPGVITVASGSTLPPVGSSVSVAGTSGSTGINGQTMAVAAVDANTRQITTDRDTSGDGTWTSGGTVTYVNSQTLRLNLRRASKLSTELEHATRHLTSQCLLRGGQYPSAYVLTGDNAWAKLIPNAFSTPTSEWEAYVAFSTSATPIRMTINWAA